jgi:cobyrinic acid a,c-diamide synthase
LAFNILRGKGSYNNQDGFIERNTLASYVHTHVAAMPDFGGNLAISSLELGG